MDADKKTGNSSVFICGSPFLFVFICAHSWTVFFDSFCPRIACATQGGADVLGNGIG